MPALVATGVATWNAQFPYGELRAVQVADSNAADVIGQGEATPPPDVPPDTGAAVDACAGSTTNPSVVFRDSSARVLHVTLGAKAGAFSDAQGAACLRRGAVPQPGGTPRPFEDNPPRVGTHEPGSARGVPPLDH